MPFSLPTAPSLLTFLLLSSILYTAHTQNEGSRCGPSHDRTGRWITIPSSSLSASELSAPSSADSSSCITSGIGDAALVQAKLPNGTWTVYNITAKVMAAKADSKSLMKILIGDADATNAVGGNSGPGTQVLQHFHTCTKRRLSMIGTSPRKMVFRCDVQEMDMSGNFIAFVGSELTVCEVMVCAKQHQFSFDGLPLTREAADLLSPTTDEASASAFGEVSDSAGGGITPVPGLVAPMNAESCPGYTNQGWSGCRKGQQCTKVYYPGANHCACFHCTVWTGRQHCERGDIMVGLKPCCFTCPDQPVCGVCITPCVPEFQRVEVIPGVLPTTPESYNSLSYSYSATTNAVNRGSNPQSVTVSFTFSQALQATMSFAKEFMFSQKASADIGIPFLNKASVEFSATQKFTTTETKQETRTSTISYALQQQVPPFTMQMVYANASAGVITVRVPVTIRTHYTCGKVTNEENAMILRSNGVVNAIDSNLQIVYGEQYPITPPIVLPQADRTCATHPQCAQFGLQGNCCPNDRGVYSSCCSFCAFKPACQEFATDNTTMCCPARTNVRNPCCN